MKMNEQQFRQGDCMVDASLAVKLADIPEGFEDFTPKSGRVVLMHGEATGHAHALYDGNVRIYRAKGSKTERPAYLRVVETALLRHEEHGVPTLPPGIYRIPSQVEHSDDMEPRVVAD